MATGITSDAVTKIQNAMDTYRQRLYTANNLSHIRNSSAFKNAIKGSKTEQKFHDAMIAIQNLIDNTTDKMRNSFNESIKNVSTQYANQDENSTTFGNLKNKYKS